MKIHNAARLRQPAARTKPKPVIFHLIHSIKSTAHLLANSKRFSALVVFAALVAAAFFAGPLASSLASGTGLTSPAMFFSAETVATFSSNDCQTAKTAWDLGQTVCAVGTGATSPRRLVWFTPNGFIAQVSDNYTSTGTDRYTIPTTGTFAQVGNWTVRAINVDGDAVATATFVVHDPAGTSADLSVINSAPAQVAPGGNLSYTITVFNLGPDAAQNVQLTDATPANTTFVSATQNSGPSFTCSGATCAGGTLAPNERATFTYVYSVDGGAPVDTVIVNTVSVTSDTNEPASQRSDNSSTAETTVANPPPTSSCTINCPDDVTQNADAGQCSAVVNYPTPTTSGTCSAVTCSPASGSTFPTGNTIVTCSAPEGDACTFTVTVVAAAAPTITTCATNKTIATDANCEAVIPDLTSEVVATGCNVIVSQSPAAGTVVGPGPVTVTITAENSAGATTCTATVNVVDTTPPVITTCATNKTFSTNGGTVQVTVPNLLGEVSATDNCTADAALVKTQSPAAGTPIGLGDTTVTITVKDAAGNPTTCSAVITVVLFRAGEFVALGQEFLRLRANAKVNTGNVGANTSLPDPNGDPDDKVEVEVGGNAKMLQSTSSIVGDTMHLSANSQAYNIFYNELDAAQASILGTRNTPLALPVVTLPTLVVGTPGTQDITVAANQTMTLAAGDYHKITVSANATLTLTGGVYNLDSLDIRSNAKLYFTDATELRVKTTLDTDANAAIRPAPSAPALLASQIVFYVEGADVGSTLAVDIGLNSTVVANFYAPNGTVQLRANTTATGAFIGKRTEISDNVQLTLKSAF